MRERKIEIVQSGRRFTMNMIEDGKQKSLLDSDKVGAALDYPWWLNPTIFNLAEELKTWKCSEAQIRQAYQSLLSGHDTHLELDIP